MQGDKTEPSVHPRRVTESNLQDSAPSLISHLCFVCETFLLLFPRMNNKIESGGLFIECNCVLAPLLWV